MHADILLENMLMNKIYGLLFILGWSFSLICFADDRDDSDASTSSQSAKKMSSDVGNGYVDIGGTSFPEEPPNNN